MAFLSVLVARKPKPSVAVPNTHNGRPGGMAGPPPSFFRASQQDRAAVLPEVARGRREPLAARASYLKAR